MRHFHYRSLQELRQSAEELGAGSVRFEANPERVKALLERHQPPALDPAVESELRAYASRVAERPMDQFFAGEWEP